LAIFIKIEGLRMRVLLLIITFTWFCCGIGFSVYEFKISTLAIAVTGFIAFLTALINYRQNTKNAKPNQSQKVSKQSFGMQAGGDVNFNFNKGNKDE